MRLYLYFNNGTLSTDICISGFSYVQNYYSNLASADNYIKCNIPFDTEISNAIKTNINNKTKAAILNDDGSAYFTGYLKQDAQFGKESRIDNISIEIVSPSYFLDITFADAVYYVDKTLKQCIEILLNKASITSYSIDSLPSKTIPVFAIEENEKVSEIMTELLKEYGYVYDFDASGSFIVNPIFNQPSTVTQIFKDASGGNLRGRVNQKVTAKSYDGVSAQFDTLEQDDDIVIYDDTGDNDISANGYFGDSENGAYCEYSVEGKAVKYIDSISSWLIRDELGHTITNESKQSSVMQGDIVNKGTTALVTVQNMTSSPLTLNEIKITGSGYFVTSTGKTKTTDGDTLNEVELKYIFNEDDAEEFANNLAKYYRYANFTVTCNSKTDYNYGSFVTVNIANLGAITGRIIQKTKQLKTDVISYTVESISEFTPATLSTVYTRMPQAFRNYSNHEVTLYKKSTTEITSTGITANAVYDFSSASLTWEGGSNNGWSDKLSDVSGDDGLLYVTSATAYGKNNTDTIEPNEWAEPIAQGMNGVDGYNTRTIQLFKRSDASPADMPLDFTLDFTQRDISITTAQLNGWQTSFPAIDDDNNPCWEIHVTALSNTTSDVITTSQWSTPAKISQDTEVTKAEIQEMINDSMTTASPVVNADVTFGGFYVDNDGLSLIEQSVTTNISVIQNGMELDFEFGTITLPSGFTATHDGNKLTITVAEGTKIKTGTINIPVIYKAYLSTDTYGDEDGDAYADEDGNSYGYWILSDESTTYNLGFGYAQIKGEIYFNGISTVASIPSDAIIGSYFTWQGADTSSTLCKDGTFKTGAVYKYNGLTWQTDTTPSHLQTALSDILADAETDLASNNPDVVALFRKISASQAIINELVVTGNALINKLQALDIYADTFTSYDNKSKGYADEAFNDAISQIESETGLDTLTDKTLISGGKIKTGLIAADAIVIGSNQVTGLDGSISDINSSLSTKASQSSLNTLSDVVSTKASQTDLESLSENVDTKASSQSVSNLAEVVDTKASSQSVKDVSDNLSNNYTNTTNMNSAIDSAKSSAIETSSNDATTKSNNAIDSALAQLVGAENVENHTIITGGKIKTDLIDAQAIFTDDLVVKDKLTSEAVDDDGNPVFEIDGTTGKATFNDVSVNGEVYATSGRFSAGIGELTTYIHKKGSETTFYIKPNNMASLIAIYIEYTDSDVEIKNLAKLLATYNYKVTSGQGAGYYYDCHTIFDYYTDIVITASDNGLKVKISSSLPYCKIYVGDLKIF